MHDPRIIKKYPNRRLYDTALSRYVTLSDVLHLLSTAEPFQVQEQRSGADITREILLQALLELERGEAALLSDSALLALLKAHTTDASQRGRTRGRLEASLAEVA